MQLRWPRCWVMPLQQQQQHASVSKHPTHVTERMKWLQNDLRNVASQLSVPLSNVGTLVAPNRTHLQKLAIHRVCKKMVSLMARPAWRKQALNHAMRMTRSNPQTVRRIFERAARQQDKEPTCPPCKCHQSAGVPGTKVLIDGHVALIPLLIPFPDGTEATPNDPLRIIALTI